MGAVGRHRSDPVIEILIAGRHRNESIRMPCTRLGVSVQWLLLTWSGDPVSRIDTWWECMHNALAGSPTGTVETYMKMVAAG
jgi:hypothetical protein